MTVAHDAESWREFVDLDRLALWMDGEELGEGRIEGVAPIGGGTQNILLRFNRSGRDFVFRRPPRHPRAESDRVMRREMQVLAALAGSDVPHPAFIAGSEDACAMGCAFYLMEPVDGFNVAVAMPQPHAGDPGMRRGMGEAMVDALVALSRVDYDAVGLSDLGRLDGWIERQVPRWRKQLDGYAALEGWPGLDALPDIEHICGWLEANRPETMRPGLVHGDYHFSNVLFRRDSADLAAIVDWELASLGDPLLDLGWLMATWPIDGETILPVTPWSGFPPIEAIVDRYLAATGRRAADARWFGVLACFKLGAILEGSHARASAGLAPKAIGDTLHTHAIALFERALRNIQD